MVSVVCRGMADEDNIAEAEPDPLSVPNSEEIEVVAIPVVEAVVGVPAGPKEHRFEKAFPEGRATARLVILPGYPYVWLTLIWEGEWNEGSEPDVWEIRWHHSSEVIWEALEAYLNRCSPAPAQLWATVLPLHIPLMVHLRAVEAMEKRGGFAPDPVNDDG
jgi:hypothetical protein